MAIVKSYKDVAPEKVTAEGTRGATIRWLISDKDGAPNFALRLFEVEPGGYTPYHKHPWEHEVFILKGKGILVTEAGETPFEGNFFIFIPPGEMHQFKNTGDEPLVFLCIVPISK